MVSTSLVSGPFVWMVVASAVGVIVASLFPFTRRRVQQVVAVGAASGGIAAFIAHEGAVHDLFVPALPWFSQIWLGGAIFTLGWAFLGWRSGRRRSRVLAVVAVPASVVMALVLFNAYFYYIPTVGGLFGSRPADKASAFQAAAVASVARPAEHHRSWPVTVHPVGHGLVLPERYDPVSSHFAAQRGWVYLPPAWWGPQRRHLPVVELLDGTPSSPTEWLRGAGLQTSADAFAASHNGYAPVFAMVDDNGSFTGDTECVDRPGSLSETYALVDVRRTLERHFGVSADPSRWGIAGLSEGGTCALAIALRHTVDFGAVGDFSGEPRQSIGAAGATLHDLFGGSRARQASYDPNLLLDGTLRSRLSAMFIVGDQDPVRRSIVAQARHAQRDGIHTELRIVPGAHTYRVWNAAVGKFIPFAWKTLAPPSLRARAGAGIGGGTRIRGIRGRLPSPLRPAEPRAGSVVPLLKRSR